MSGRPKANDTPRGPTSEGSASVRGGRRRATEPREVLYRTAVASTGVRREEERDQNDTRTQTTHSLYTHAAGNN